MEWFVLAFGQHVDDHHDFIHAHEVHIEEWQIYWSPNYVFIIEIPTVPTFVSILGVIAIVYSSGLVGGGGNVNGDGIIRNRVAIRSGGIGPSIST
jgi:hypothetical protein